MRKASTQRQAGKACKIERTCIEHYLVTVRNGKMFTLPKKSEVKSAFEPNGPSAGLKIASANDQISCLAGKNKMAGQI